MDNAQRAAKLIASLADRGVALHAEGRNLAYRGPNGVITKEDWAGMYSLKPYILALLAPPVIVYSRLLGERVRLVEALAIPSIPKASEPVTYDRGELQRMQGLPPDAVRAIHRSKRYFGGSYLGPTEQPQCLLDCREAHPTAETAEESAAR